MAKNKDLDPSKEKSQRLMIRRIRVRILVSIIMLMMAMLGILIMDLYPRSYWLYSRLMAIVFAFLSISLFWYTHRGQNRHITNMILHQMLHWLGLLLSIYLVDVFVNSGVINSTQAGLMTLTLLALTTFLSGVYTNPSFMLIGIVLGLFAAGASLIQEYLTIVMIPVILISAVIIYLLSRHEKRKANHREYL